ncbi:hypothetical protein, partial [Methanosarcina sp. UBA5]|uniref:hypothetical protein n=1 Tax=Methanosarcina sp. UBA5 TaxID=1915593 RepID=UPI0025DC3C7B
MKETRCEKIRRRHTFITFLGMATLAFLMMVSVASSNDSATLVNVASSNDSATLENATFWYYKGDALSKLGEYNESIQA